MGAPLLRLDHGVILSIYFHDPNGLRLEITTPLHPNWNRSTDRGHAGLGHGNYRLAKRGQGQIRFIPLLRHLAIVRRFGSEGPQGEPGHEVSLKIGCLVDGSVHIEEALGRPSRLEPLHFVLAATHDLVGVFGAIVLPLPLLMRTGQVQCRKADP